ncbi:hypothetical protein RIF29_18109 [Crotalaria pallida]|uniref:Uncharacterized protein n=1 Tax=Crotalaria pallida TaxID=3830 RepID=A0AAN9FP95_CROPI
MEIVEKLVKLRYHFLAALLFCVTLYSLILLAPRFITLFTYFWPLFLSTTIVLSLVFIFAKTSSSSSSESSSSLQDTDSSSLHKTLLDYVSAGHLLDEDALLDIHTNKSD